jgi:hypothetical protein
MYCLVKTRIQGGESHTRRSRYACVWEYLVANPNSTLLLERLPLIKSFCYGGLEISSSPSMMARIIS